MGKYMRKAKITGDVAVMEILSQSQSSLGVRTRAKTHALQTLQSTTNTQPPNNPETSYLQLRNRRLEKILVNDAKKHQSPPPRKNGCGLNPNPNPSFSPNPNSDSPNRCFKSEERVISDFTKRPCNEIEAEDLNDLGLEPSFGENCLDFESRERYILVYWSIMFVCRWKGFSNLPCFLKFSFSFFPFLCGFFSSPVWFLRKSKKGEGKVDKGASFVEFSRFLPVCSILFFLKKIFLALLGFIFAALLLKSSLRGLSSYSSPERSLFPFPSFYWSCWYHFFFFFFPQRFKEDVGFLCILSSLVNHVGCLASFFFCLLALS